MSQQDLEDGLLRPTSLGLALLTASVTALAVASIAWWLVPPYLLLMIWMLGIPRLFRTRVVDDDGDDSHADAEDTDDREQDIPKQTRTTRDESDSPTNTVSAVLPTRTRRKRKRANAQVAAVQPKPSRAQWVQVGPGKFVRVERSTPAFTNTQATGESTPQTDPPSLEDHSSDVGSPTFTNGSETSSEDSSAVETSTDDASVLWTEIASESGSGSDTDPPPTTDRAAESPDVSGPSSGHIKPRDPEPSFSVSNDPDDTQTFHDHDHEQSQRHNHEPADPRETAATSGDPRDEAMSNHPSWGCPEIWPSGPVAVDDNHAPSGASMVPRPLGSSEPDSGMERDPEPHGPDHLGDFDSRLDPLSTPGSPIPGSSSSTTHDAESSDDPGGMTRSPADERVVAEPPTSAAQDALPIVATGAISTDSFARDLEVDESTRSLSMFDPPDSDRTGDSMIDRRDASVGPFVISEAEDASEIARHPIDGSDVEPDDLDDAPPSGGSGVDGRPTADAPRHLSGVEAVESEPIAASTPAGTPVSSVDPSHDAVNLRSRDDPDSLTLGRSTTSTDGGVNWRATRLCRSSQTEHTIRLGLGFHWVRDGFSRIERSWANTLRGGGVGWRASGRNDLRESEADPRIGSDPSTSHGWPLMGPPIPLGVLWRLCLARAPPFV